MKCAKGNGRLLAATMTLAGGKELTCNIAINPHNSYYYIY